MVQTLRERRDCYYGQYWNPPRDVPMCANCEHFYQHYIKQGTDYHPLSFGHCAYPRMKDRDTFDLCEHFTSKYQR